MANLREVTDSLADVKVFPSAFHSNQMFSPYGFYPPQMPLMYGYPSMMSMASSVPVPVPFHPMFPAFISPELVEVSVHTTSHTTHETISVAPDMRMSNMEHDFLWAIPLNTPVEEAQEPIPAIVLQTYPMAD
jgi:hypothetical protein